MKTTLLCALLLLCNSASFLCQPATAQETEERQEKEQTRVVPCPQWPEDGKVVLPGPWPSICRVWIQGDASRTPLEFGFDPKGNDVYVFLNNPPGEGGALEMEFIDESAVLDSGAVVLSALDAEVIGDTARLENNPGNYRIGYWSNFDDFVRWRFTIPAGVYQALLVYSQQGNGATVSINFAKSTHGEVTFERRLATLGTWYRYRTVPLGRISINGEDNTIEVRQTGIMNLKSLILLPE